MIDSKRDWFYRFNENVTDSIQTEAQTDKLENLTIKFKIRMLKDPGNAGHYMICSTLSDNTGGFYASIIDSGISFRMFSAGSSSTLNIWSNVLTLNTWHDIELKTDFAANTVSLWVDTVKQVDKNLGSNVSMENSSPLIIGRYWADTYYFYGDLKDFSYTIGDDIEYNFPLNEREIKSSIKEYGKFLTLDMDESKSMTVTLPTDGSLVDHRFKGWVRMDLKPSKRSAEFPLVDTNTYSVTANYTDGTLTLTDKSDNSTFTTDRQYTFNNGWQYIDFEINNKFRVGSYEALLPTDLREKATADDIKILTSTTTFKGWSRDVQLYRKGIEQFLYTYNEKDKGSDWNYKFDDTGNQYVDTGVIYQEGQIFEFEFDAFFTDINRQYILSNYGDVSIALSFTVNYLALTTDKGNYNWSSSTLNLNQWYHIKLTHDGSNWSLEVDGVTDSNTPAFESPKTSNNPFWIGARNSSNPTDRGVNLKNVSLKLEGDEMFYYPMSEGSGQLSEDHSVMDVYRFENLVDGNPFVTPIDLYSHDPKTTSWSFTMDLYYPSGTSIDYAPIIGQHRDGGVFGTFNIAYRTNGNINVRCLPAADIQTKLPTDKWCKLKFYCTPFGYKLFIDGDLRADVTFNLPRTSWTNNNTDFIRIGSALNSTTTTAIMNEGQMVKNITFNINGVEQFIYNANEKTGLVAEDIGRDWYYNNASDITHLIDTGVIIDGISKDLILEFDGRFKNLSDSQYILGCMDYVNTHNKGYGINIQYQNNGVIRVASLFRPWTNSGDIEAFQWDNIPDVVNWHVYKIVVNGTSAELFQDNVSLGTKTFTYPLSFSNRESILIYQNTAYQRVGDIDLRNFKITNEGDVLFDYPMQDQKDNIAQDESTMKMYETGRVNKILTTIDTYPLKSGDKDVREFIFKWDGDRTTSPSPNHIYTWNRYVSGGKGTYFQTYAQPTAAKYTVRAYNFDGVPEVTFRGALDFGKWYKIRIEFDGFDSLKLYVDDVLVQNTVGTRTKFSHDYQLILQNGDNYSNANFKMFRYEINGIEQFKYLCNESEGTTALDRGKEWHYRFHNKLISDVNTNKVLTPYTEIECDIKIAKLETQRIFGCYTQEVDNTFGFIVHNFDAFRFYWKNNSSLVLSTTLPSTLINTWVHVKLLADYRNKTVELFLDNVSQGVKSIPETAILPTDTLRIGSTLPNDNAFSYDGAIKNFVLRQETERQLTYPMQEQSGLVAKDVDLLSTYKTSNGSTEWIDTPTIMHDIDTKSIVKHKIVFKNVGSGVNRIWSYQPSTIGGLYVYTDSRNVYVDSTQSNNTNVTEQVGNIQLSDDVWYTLEITHYLFNDEVFIECSNGQTLHVKKWSNKLIYTNCKTRFGTLWGGQQYIGAYEFKEITSFINGSEKLKFQCNERSGTTAIDRGWDWHYRFNEVVGTKVNTNIRYKQGQDFDISFDLNAPLSGLSNILATFSEDNSYGFSIGYNSTNIVVSSRYFGNQQDSTFTAGLVANTWQTVRVVKTGLNIEVFVGGVSKGTLEHTRVIPSGELPIQIGSLSETLKAACRTRNVSILLDGDEYGNYALQEQSGTVSEDYGFMKAYEFKHDTGRYIQTDINLLGTSDKEYIFDAYFEQGSDGGSQFILWERNSLAVQLNSGSTNMAINTNSSGTGQALNFDTIISWNEWHKYKVGLYDKGTVCALYIDNMDTPVEVKNIAYDAGRTPPADSTYVRVAHGTDNRSFQGKIKNIRCIQDGIEKFRYLCNEGSGTVAVDKARDWYYEFNYQGNRINVPFDIRTLPIDGLNFTVEFDAYIPSSTPNTMSYGMLICQWTGGGSGQFAICSKNSRIFLPNGTGYLESSISFNTNQWSSYKLVYTQGSAKWYKDGVLDKDIALNPLTAWRSTGPTEMSIGSNQGGTAFSLGSGEKIKNVKFSSNGDTIFNYLCGETEGLVAEDRSKAKCYNSGGISDNYVVTTPISLQNWNASTIQTFSTSFFMKVGSSTSNECIVFGGSANSLFSLITDFRNTNTNFVVIAPRGNAQSTVATLDYSSYLNKWILVEFEWYRTGYSITLDGNKTEVNTIDNLIAWRDTEFIGIFDSVTKSRNSDDHHIKDVKFTVDGVEQFRYLCNEGNGTTAIDRSFIDPIVDDPHGAHNQGVLSRLGSSNYFYNGYGTGYETIRDSEGIYVNGGSSTPIQMKQYAVNTRGTININQSNNITLCLGFVTKEHVQFSYPLTSDDISIPHIMLEQNLPIGSAPRYASSFRINDGSWRTYGGTAIQGSALDVPSVYINNLRSTDIYARLYENGVLYGDITNGLTPENMQSSYSFDRLCRGGVFRNQDLIIFDRDLTTTEMDTVASYINNKWTGGSYDDNDIKSLNPYYWFDPSIYNAGNNGTLSSANIHTEVIKTANTPVIKNDGTLSDEIIHTSVDKTPNYNGTITDEGIHTEVFRKVNERLVTVLNPGTDNNWVGYWPSKGIGTLTPEGNVSEFRSRISDGYTALILTEKPNGVSKIVVKADDKYYTLTFNTGSTYDASSLTELRDYFTDNIGTEISIEIEYVYNDETPIPINNGIIEGEVHAIETRTPNNGILASDAIHEISFKDTNSPIKLNDGVITGNVHAEDLKSSPNNATLNDTTMHTVYPKKMDYSYQLNSVKVTTPVDLYATPITDGLTFSIEFDFYYPSGKNSTWDMVVGQWGGSGSGSFSIVKSGNIGDQQIQFTTPEGTGIKAVILDFTPYKDRWVRLRYEWTQSTAKVFIDNTQVISETHGKLTSWRNTDNAKNITIGSSVTNEFTSMLDFRVKNMSFVINGETQFYYEMNEGNGSKTFDLSRDNHGIISKLASNDIHYKEENITELVKHNGGIVGDLHRSVIKAVPNDGDLSGEVVHSEAHKSDTSPIKVNDGTITGDVHYADTKQNPINAVKVGDITSSVRKTQESNAPVLRTSGTVVGTSRESEIATANNGTFVGKINDQDKTALNSGTIEGDIEVPGGTNRNPVDGIITGTKLARSVKIDQSATKTPGKNTQQSFYKADKQTISIDPRYKWDYDAQDGTKIVAGRNTSDLIQVDSTASGAYSANYIVDETNTDLIGLLLDPEGVTGKGYYTEPMEDLIKLSDTRLVTTILHEGNRDDFVYGITEEGTICLPDYTFKDENGRPAININEIETIGIELRRLRDYFSILLETDDSNFTLLTDDNKDLIR